MMHGKTTTANVDVKQWARLAELAKQFGCDLLLERVIIPDLKAVLSQHPYHVFCSASRIQDIELAVAAIKALKHDYTLNPTPVVTDCGKRHSTYSSPLSKLTQEQWQGCHGDYFFALVKAIAEYEEEGIEGAYAWGTVAANFKNHLPTVSHRGLDSGLLSLCSVQAHHPDPACNSATAQQLIAGMPGLDHGLAKGPRPKLLH